MKNIWLPLSTPKQASLQVSGRADRNYTALKVRNKLLFKSYQAVNFELLVWRYERVTLKNFFVGCRYVVADWCAFVRYRKRFRVSLVNNCFDVAVFSI